MTNSNSNLFLEKIRELINNSHYIKLELLDNGNFLYCLKDIDFRVLLSFNFEKKIEKSKKEIYEKIYDIKKEILSIKSLEVSVYSKNTVILKDSIILNIKENKLNEKTFMKKFIPFMNNIVDLLKSQRTKENNTIKTNHKKVAIDEIISILKRNIENDDLLKIYRVQNELVISIKGITIEEIKRLESFSKFFRKDE